MRSLALVAAIALASAIAGADVVYLNNGKIYEGKVTRHGDKVLVEMSFGQIAVDASDVRQIVRTEAEPTPQAPATSEAGSEPQTPRAFSLERITLPDTLAFLFMRRLTDTPPGVESYEIRQQARQWQNAAHDRLRKGGTGWLRPREFQSARRVFLDRLAEATDLTRQFARLDEDDPDEQAERRRVAAAASAKTLDAAQAWADPVLRAFLIGVAYYQAGNYGPSAAAFGRCVREAPLVAAFHQGHGLALAGLGRPLDAVEAFTKMLRLRPDSPEALELLRDGMQDVPGVETRREIYARAKALSDAYPAVPQRRSRRRRDGISWMLPGEFDQDRYSPLPVPKYDRLIFRQAVGAATADQALLLDEGAVEGAVEAFVFLGPEDPVPAEILRRPRARRGQELPPLRTVTVADAVFEPVETGPEDEDPRRQAVTVCALGIYAEMGDEIIRREAMLRPRGGPDRPRVEPGLAAGDAAAPVLSPDGRLLGFLAGKTDVTELGGGPDRFIGIGELEPVLERGSRSGRPRRRYGAVQRTGPARQAEGQVFIVRAVHCETLD